MKNKILVLAILAVLIWIDSYAVLAKEVLQNNFTWRCNAPENLGAGDSITVFADGAAESHSLISALYKKGRLVDLAVCEGNSATLTLPYGFSRDSDWEIKAALWDGISSMSPLGNCFEFRLGTDLDITDKFTDVAFLNAVRAVLGKGQEAAIYQSDVDEITTLDVNNKNIHRLDGIEYFTGLEQLDCSSNELTSLDVSENKKLKVLDCYANYFVSLDFSDNTELEVLDVSYDMELVFLDISKNTALKVLECNYSFLDTLDVSKNTELTKLICFSCKLERLDVSCNTKLQKLKCKGNYLTSLDISHNHALTYLDCSYNKMTSIDDVTGWQNSGLILDENLLFYPQKKRMMAVKSKINEKPL